MPNLACSMAVEDLFGPVVASTCLGGFDFTLLFEESILTIVPIGIACGWSILRFLALRHEPPRVHSSWLLICKMFAFLSYEALQITLLVLWASRDIPKTRLTLTCVSITICCYIFLCGISYLEHRRSIRPSTLLTVFLGTTLILDLARVRALFFLPQSQTVARVFLSDFVVKILIFALEITEKRHLLINTWKDTAPEAASGIINRAVFLWLNRTFVKGFRTLLTVKVLPQLDDEILSASSPTKLMKEWERSDQSKKDELFWLFLKHFKWPILAGVLPRLAYTGFNFSQPYLIQRVLDFTSEPNLPNRNNIAYGLIGAYFIVYIGISSAYSAYQHKTYRLVTLYRGSLIPMIFDKILRMSPSGIDNAEAITLMSADIDRIGSSLHLIHEMYASVIESGIALWLLYDFLGVAMVASIVWVLICLLAGIPIAKAAGNAQSPWLEAIEERLAATAKALSATKSVKIAGFAAVVTATIAGLRGAEIRASRRHRILNVFVEVTSFASSALAPVFGFTAYVLIAKARDSGTLTQGVAFGALSIFTLIEYPMNYAIYGMEDLQTVRNSFRRIQEYLVSEEREDYRIILDSSPTSILPNGFLDHKDELASTSFKQELAASVEGVSARYSPEGNPILNDLTFHILRGETTIVVGPVGSGKSSLLNLLLGEMPIVTGLVSTSFSKAAYSSQSPSTSWGTVRNNIVGMSSWDEKWYSTVVTACALSTDFTELPQGDQTQTGMGGSRLSGGQQIRVSLARALYSRHPTIILDDVVTGFDRCTEQHILNAVFGPHGLLKSSNSTVIWATSSAGHLRFADNIILLGDNGKISKQGKLESFDIDEVEIKKLDSTPKAIPDKIEPQIPEDVLQDLGLLEDPSPGVNRQTGDMRIYGYYAKIAGWRTIGFYLCACAVMVFGLTFPYGFLDTVWVQWWTNANAIHPNERIGYWVGVFAALGLLTVIGCATADFTFNLVVLPKTSKRFHELLLNTTMRAPTSFLTSTDAGTTINRFSQDLELIDNDLPQALDRTVFQFFSAIVSAVLVFIGSGYVAAAIPICIIILGLIQFYYLRTSRQIRLLDIEAKAPLFSHLIETVQGIASIRAYGWTQNYTERNHQAMNTSQRPYYLLFCIQRWLTLVLDLYNTGIAVLLVAIITNIHNSSTVFIGVALLHIVTFSSTLQNLITEWTQVEMALGAISRIRAYVLNVKNENLPSENGSVPPQWPEHGTITFKDISASYEQPTEPVLKNIDFSVRAGEKMAICGRTGSGKSSLISTLLRMIEIDSGSISIDDIDISTIPRQEVRSRMNVLPQDPFFLKGSVRENLDPTGSLDDTRLIEVLREVHLWEQVESRGGLDGDIGDEILSHGQRQFFCLARAVVKRGKILIMDEATSSIDNETDDILQAVIRREFEGCTIIAIAHKLETVMDFDRIILLDRGRIVEMGPPRELLARETSSFRALYEQLKYGKAEK